MGLQIGIDPTGRYVIVLAARLMLTIDQAVTSQIERYNRIVAHGDFGSTAHAPFFDESPKDAEVSRMDRWIESLPLAERLTPASISDAVATLGFIHLGPLKRLPPRRFRPSAVYGHLPFHGICSGSEIFYRYESYPASHRIDLANAKIVQPGTYASPMSDLPLVPTGLAAVARYALPTLLPARWRYEIRPEPGTMVHYGASVPMYGQSGGGVEVMFPSPFKNVGPIANPIILPIF